MRRKWDTANEALSEVRRSAPGVVMVALVLWLYPAVLVVLAAVARSKEKIEMEIEMEIERLQLSDLNRQLNK